MYNPQMLDIEDSAARSGRLTYDDWLALDHSGGLHEIVDGALVVTSWPSPRHQRVVGRLHVAIATYLETQPIGEVLVAPLGVVLSLFDVVEPDVLFVSASRASIVTEQAVHGAPDLVVEVLSPTTSYRDLGEKLALYEKSGVLEFWAVDPDAQVVRVFRRREDALSPSATLAVGTAITLSTHLLPSLQIDLSQLFR